MSIPSHSRIRTALGLCAVTLMIAPPARGQSYTVERIDAPPEAATIVGTGLNDHGQAVGWGLFFGSTQPTLRSWSWTSQAGLVFLTPPPGQSLLRAIDVNAAGVIAGDGGYDTGVAWRYAGGTFELLGVLPGGDTVSTAGGINAAGEVAGASRYGPSFLVPPSAILAKPGQPLAQILASATGTDVNDAGQLVGYTYQNRAFRHTPGAGVQLLGALGVHDLNWAWEINSAGDVVGEAADANTQYYDKSWPFLYTSSGGMQEIGSFPGYSRAVSVNDARQVVGNYYAPILPFTYSWVWSAQTGVRYLKDLIDPALHLNLLAVARINSSGQILCQAVDNQTGNHVVAVLTPIASGFDAFCYGSVSACPCANTGLAGRGCDNSALTGGAMLAGSGSTSPDTVILAASGELATAFSIFLQGDAAQAPVPFGDGARCIAGSLVRLYAKSAAGGSVIAPDVAAGEATITQRSAFLGDPIPAGATRHYQVYYRDPDPSFCPAPAGNTWNVSNALTIPW